MKKLVVSKENPCKACLSCVQACSQAFYKTFDPDLSCIRIAAKPDGEPKVMNCIMCGKCVEACPMKVMVMAPGATAPSKCIACGICAKACPMDILSIEEK